MAEGLVDGARVEIEAALLERAIAGIEASFEETLAMEPWQRAAICDATAERLTSGREGLLDDLCAEARFLTRGDMELEFDRAIDVLRFTAAAVREGTDETVNLPGSPRGSGAIGLISRVPLGPLLAITAFNGPLLIAAHKISAAAGIGAPVVVKPSPRVPAAAVALGEVFVESGWPASALVVAPVDDDLTMSLVEDARLPVISFTGSAPVGWSIREAAPRKHVHLELGGIGSTLVAAESDLDRVVESCVTGGFVRSGQACLSVQRILVEARACEELVEKLEWAIGRLSFGDPDAGRFDVGPLVDGRSADRVEELIGEAVSRGARLVIGGERSGNLIAPCLLVDVDESMAIATSEAFGPVIAVSAVEALTDAVHLVNGMPGLLNVGLFVRDIDEAFGLARRIRAGAVLINGSNAWRVDNMPFGGTGHAGTGREGARFLMEEISERKTVVVVPR